MANFQREREEKEQTPNGLIFCFHIYKIFLQAIVKDRLRHILLLKG